MSIVASPAISVALPVHNAARYLRPALDSILAQTFRDFELIAVDDGSADSSREILEGYARRDARIRVISRPNTGIVGALNDAIAAARAPVLARMDADDIAFPERFARQAAFLEAHPEIVLLGSSVVAMDSGGRSVKRVPRRLGHDEIDRDLLQGDGGALIHPAVIMRTEAVRRIGGYRLEAQFTEDLDLFLRLAEVGRVANLAEPYLKYRVHASSVNFTRSQNRRAVMEWILREAYARRGLVWNAAAMARKDESWRDLALLHQDWAVTSLDFGRLTTSFKHALLACRRRPSDRQSWRVLKYVTNAAVRQAFGRRRQSGERRDPLID